MDVAALVAAISPLVTAAVGTYGAAVLAQAQEHAADATVGWGRKILQRVFGTDPADEEVPEVIADLAEAPDDADLQAALRVRIRKALAADPALADDVRRLMEEAEAATAATGSGVMVTATGRGVAAGRDITGSVVTGDNSSTTSR
ncbi:hypothetical protein AB0K18_10415 [Nonomuraea sp. NPDC049421]|uniref:hypothetical protein n=1 Tax=Nonomuraea sp. NPDC049421 TaxID=3155275 RepID=UPI003438E7E8